MSILNEIFSLCKESNKITFQANYQAIIPQEKTNLEFGDIVEIFFDRLIFVAVWVDESEAILMSEFWELATNTDMIVNLKHPLGDKWIIELDNRLFIEAESDIYYYSSLPQEYKNTLKKVLDGEAIPAHLSGPKLPYNLKDTRYKFKKQELKRNLIFNKNIFVE